MQQRAAQFLAVATATLLILLLVGILRVTGPSKIVPVAINKVTRLPTHQQWCPSPTRPFPSITPFPTNFWYVKTFKTGSTTLSSVFNNLCVHYGIVWLRWDTVKTVAKLDSTGSTATPLELGMRQAVVDVYAVTDIKHVGITNHIPYNDGAAAQLRQPMMRFTSVRHPVARVHSHFIQNLCFKTARQFGWAPGSPVDGTGPAGPSACDKDDSLYLKLALMNDTVDSRGEFARKQRDLMFRYIQGSTTLVEDAADQYDFIFVSERMNEALVIFMLDYGLTYEDIAYLPSKVRTGRYKTAKDMPKDLNDYILSINRKDFDLWQLANKRLDQKKAQLQAECGADIVTAALRKFEQLLQEVSAECSNFIEWYKSHGYSAPYTYTGVPGFGDESGLGFRCVRHVARQFMAGADPTAKTSWVKGIM